MKRISFLPWIVAALLVIPLWVAAQTDDVRRATGLPIPIGQPVIYGSVTLRGLGATEQKPVIFVSLVLNGVPTDRAQTNERGFYYFLRSPNDGAVLVFEVDNSEVGRTVLSAGSGSSVRRDIEIDWQAVLANRSAPGVISAKNAYNRTPEANKIFDRAAAAAKSKKIGEALTLLQQIVADDPKDFVAWTEIGTLYFGDLKFSDAEVAYGKALEQRSDFMPALMNLGKLHLARKKPEMAISVFLLAARFDPTSADAFRYLGEAYLEAKQGTKAVIALNEALRLQPAAMADIHLRLAALYDAAGARDRASAEYKAFLEKRPDHPDRKKLEAYIKSNPPK